MTVDTPEAPDEIDMSNKLVIIPRETEINPDGWRRSCHLEFSNGNKISDLWWDYPSAVPALDAKDSDAYLIAVILLAMKLNADIEIRGSVSRSLLANLTEFQRAWNKWCPDLYNEIKITADDIRDKEKSSTCAVAAFSGGIDAQFTVFRHASGLAKYDRQKIIAGALVHGFDIPLSDELGFDQVEKNAKLILDDFDIKLFAVRTNIRNVISINWEHYCGAALVSVLVGFQKISGVGLIGSSDSYDELWFPWGTNPITDPLLGSSAFVVKHDGSGFNRIEKVRVLSSWRIGLEHLRVCWEGGVVHKNCGYCEKCIRTRMNFLLAGQPNPPCFDGPLTERDIDKLTLGSEGVRTEWRTILAFMRRNNVCSEFIPNVEHLLRRPTTRWGRFLPVGSRRRTWIKRIAKRINITS